jgi:hypothetical protein
MYSKPYTQGSTTEWTKLHTDKFPKLCCTPNTVVVTINAQKISLRRVSGNNFRDNTMEYTRLNIHI